MCVYHVFYGVCDDIPTRKRVQHTVVSHGNTIVDGYGVEFGSIASHLFYFLFYNLSNLVQVCMSWYELGEGVYNSYDWFTELFMFHTCCDP